MCHRQVTSDKCLFHAFYQQFNQQSLFPPCLQHLQPIWKTHSQNLESSPKQGSKTLKNNLKLPSSILIFTLVSPLVSTLHHLHPTTATSHLRSLSPRGFSVLMPVIAMCSLPPWGSKDAQEPAKSLGWVKGVVYPNPQHPWDERYIYLHLL